MHLPQMTEKAVTRRKGNLAPRLRAFVVAASRVKSQLVLVEISAFSEVLVALIASVRPLVLMDALVVLRQIALRHKALVAYLALVWPLLRAWYDGGRLACAHRRGRRTLCGVQQRLQLHLVRLRHRGRSIVSSRLAARGFSSCG